MRGIARTTVRDADGGPNVVSGRPRIGYEDRAGIRFDLAAVRSWPGMGEAARSREYQDG